MAGAPLAAIRLPPSWRTGRPFTTLALDQAAPSPSKDLEPLDAAFAIGTFLPLAGIGIARVPFLDATVDMPDTTKRRVLRTMPATAGMDEALVEAWIEVGRQRAIAATGSHPRDS